MCVWSCSLWRIWLSNLFLVGANHLNWIEFNVDCGRRRKRITSMRFHVCSLDIRKRRNWSPCAKGQLQNNQITNEMTNKSNRWRWNPFWNSPHRSLKQPFCSVPLLNELKLVSFRATEANSFDTIKPAWWIKYGIEEIDSMSNFSVCICVIERERERDCRMRTKQEPSWLIELPMRVLFYRLASNWADRRV